MNRGDVWLVNLDPTVGEEMRKSRPAVIVNNDDVGVLPLCIIVPITDWKENFNSRVWMVRLEPASSNGLTKASAADCFQIRVVSKERMIRRIGRLMEIEMTEIGISLAGTLGIM